jgi:hypothetical protein
LLSFVIHRMAKWKELPNFNISILFGNVSHLFLFSDSEVLESFEIKYTWSKSFRGNFSTFVSIYCGRSRFLISHLRKIYYCRRQWPIMRKIKFISLFLYFEFNTRGHIWPRKLFARVSKCGFNSMTLCVYCQHWNRLKVSDINIHTSGFCMYSAKLLFIHSY